MRSLLFVPGDSEKKLAKSLQAGADVLLLDLEDSVGPDRKAEARKIISAFVGENGKQASATLYVRVNDFTTSLIDDDLAAIMPARPAGIMLPKAIGPKDIARLSAKLRVHEAENGIEDGATRIVALIAETAAGVLAAPAFNEAQPRLAGVTWGAEDLSADVGASMPRNNEGRYTDTFRLARSLTILAAATVQTAAIDTVFVNFRDTGALKAECAEAERDGFTAKMAIHPAQVPVINEVFTPSAESVAHSHAVVEAFAAAGNPGVIGIDGQMYDRPHLRRAERILQRARAAGVA